MIHPILFWIFAVLAVVSALFMVATPNPVRSALGLVATFICVAVFYVMLSAQFIAAVQIIVYAGAIMVLFLFVIMLLNLGAPEALRERGSLQPLVAVILGIAFLAVLFASSSLIRVGGTPALETVYKPLGTVEGVGLALFAQNQPWVLPFEMTSILLLIAVIGAIIMAKRKI